jgi:hypothetical protein
VDRGFLYTTVTEKILIFMVKTLMISYKIAMFCTSGQDPCEQGAWEPQLIGALGEEDNTKILVGLWGCR